MISRIAPAIEKTTYAKRHALLARVHYLDTHEFSYILFLKPSLTGDEPMDILQYQKAQPDFPQESTMDQYFDEAQWESYRKLGELIGSAVFAKPGDRPDDLASCSEGRWSPSEFRPPTTRGKEAGPHLRRSGGVSLPEPTDGGKFAS